MHAVVSEGLTMTTDNTRAPPSCTGSRRGVPADFVIKWERFPTVFGHHVLVATVAYPYADAAGLTRLATLVLGKVIEECVQDPFCRFVFWLTADFNIESTRLGAKTRQAIRAELAKTITPPTDLEAKNMNMRMNSLPDYLRVFYLEDYFESMIKNKKKGH
ncbi:MAG: hypothetical protein ACXV2D_02915 [Halobacteriota archaeon]